MIVTSWKQQGSRMIQTLSYSIKIKQVQILKIFVLTIPFLTNVLQRSLVELICCFFVASWTGVIKYHGPQPVMRPKQVIIFVLWLLCYVAVPLYTRIFYIYNDTEVFCFLVFKSGFCGQSYLHDWLHHFRTNDCLCCHHAEASWLGW